jgi:Flp pilus assembly protein TadD
MRLPVSSPSSTSQRPPLRMAAPGLLLFLSFVTVGPLCARAKAQTAKAQTASSVTAARERIHQSDQWALIQPHLADPATSTAKELELQADILRARRFPEDALDYYRYAMTRGGDAASLMNKLGLAELEMRNIELARGYFQRVVKLKKKDAEAWNNLGAVEYLDGIFASAVSDYKRAAKLNKHEAVFHANLATVYFEQKDYGAARREIATAMKLDPKIFEHQSFGGGGVAAHVLSSEDRARFALEMAKLYARDGLEAEMLQSLGRACEAGMDIQREMRRDPALAKFEMDPRVLVLVHNAEALHATHGATASATPGSAMVPLPAQPKPQTE